MEGGLFRLLLVAGLLAAVLPAAAATFGPQPGASCKPTLLATQVALFCAPDMPNAQCCEPVVAAVDLGGGVPCLCRVAAEPQLVMAGVNATHLLTLYTSCGGLRPGGAHLAAACEGPAPSAAVVSAPPPSPGGPRRKQPAHEAPPPPPSTEKPSPPPQQHDGAAHSKAVPAYAATSPLAPAPAPAPAYEGCVGPPPPSSSFLFEIFQQQDGGGQVPIGQVAEFSRRILVEQSCDPYGLAGQLAKFCGDTDSPSSSCCQVVIRVINEDCLCQVVEMPEFIVAGMDTRQMWSLYVSCHGTRPIPIDKSICRFQSPPPPPPPSPSAPSPPHSPPNSPNPEKPLTESNIENMVERLLGLATEATVGAYVVAAVLLLACAGLLFAVWKLGRGRRVTGDEEPEREPGRHVELVPRERAPHRKSAEGRHHETQRQPPQTHTVVAPSAPPIPEGMFE